MDHKNSKLYNFVHGCACSILSVHDYSVMMNMHKKTQDKEVASAGVVGGLSQNSLGGFYARRPSLQCLFPELKVEQRTYPEINGTNVHVDDVPLSNKTYELMVVKLLAYAEEVFNIGDVYPDMIQLKSHIIAYAVITKFQLRQVLSNEYKVVVYYKAHNCSWRIYATRLLDSAFYIVRTYCSKHPCIIMQQDDGSAHKASSSNWVASVIKRKLRNDPNYKAKWIITDLHELHHVNITYKVA
ncbi:hypothetical protein GIB67_039227 [Kingdonia uniflora]|uniref:Transposase MuDR plant domain-containing protein n=1 Tax=Kingdonia uniflora TaxID=39325 RepID=A0A7J7MLX3_9MAGN|nr:hypothetical protein GIB67_039227 [Kingdonia uniflora]